MIIKKYIVTDIKEALIMAKYELGPDAIILNQSKVKDKKWYLPFSRDEYEILVGLEESVDGGENFERELEEIVNKNPIFKETDERIKKQLSGYCRLKMIEDGKLSLDNTLDFINTIYKDNPFNMDSGLSTINIFVGPTGVGKTTSIAKLAAREYINNNKKVGLITIDTYKIGAVEQLKTYSDILGTKFEVVKSPKEINEKIYKLKDCDLILIDTLGTSQMNTEKMEDISKYIDAIKMDVKVYLTISISANKGTIYSILDRYRTMDYDAIVLTKFDEIVNYENIWNILDYNSEPVEFFTYGQNVPEDIDRASLDKIIEYRGV